MTFRDANGDPEALHRRMICLLKELARRTGLEIVRDRVLAQYNCMQDGRCLHRPDKIAEKIGISLDCPPQNPDLYVSLWPAGTAAQADCFYEKVDRKAFLALNEPGWKIRPNSGFHFAQRPLFGSGTSLHAREHLEYFFSGERPYGRYYFPGTGEERRKELTPHLIESWQRRRVITSEARNKIEKERDCTNHKSIDLKPGFWVYRIWKFNKVIALDDRGQLEGHIMQALDTPLQTWGEELERVA